MKKGEEGRIDDDGSQERTDKHPPAGRHLPQAKDCAFGNSTP